MNEADQEQLNRYRSMLRINKHRLDEELEAQGETQERISSAVARFQARVQEAKDDLTRAEARLNEDFRDGERITKDAVEAKVKRHPARIKAWEAHQSALQDLNEWEGLLDAWKVRCFDARKLCELYSSQYFALDKSFIPRERDGRSAGERYERPSTRRVRAPLE